MDTREFKRIEQPSDFKLLENYVDSVDPTAIGLKRVIQPYYLRSYLRCSLTTCRQEHLDGYLVELSDGRLSNIGHVCGSRPENFGESFSAGVAQLSAANIRADASRRLQDRAGIVARFDEARRLAADVSVWWPRVAIFLESFGLTDQLRKRFDQGDSAILEVRERSAQEIANLVDSGQYQTRAAARYEERRIGALQGLAAVRQNFSLQEMLKGSETLRGINPLEMSTEDLVAHVRIDQTVRTQISLIAEWLAAARRLLTNRNFSLIARLVGDEKVAQQLGGLTISDLDAMIEKATETAAIKLRAGGSGSAAADRRGGRKAREHARRAAAQSRYRNPFIDR